MSLKIINERKPRLIRERRMNGRRGSVLVLVILLMFALLAIAGLVIDLGLARHTQARMQSGAELAAREGLRFRDALPPNPQNPTPTPTPEQLDVERRMQANRMLSLLYTGDVDPQTGLAQGQVQPQLILAIQDGQVIFDENGNPRFEALRLIDPVPDPYVPQLDADPSTNAANQEMASGTYAPNPDFTSDEPRDAWIDQNGEYQRRDFIPASADTAESNAFLVQLRRTSDNLDPNDPERIGGPLPNLFSLAAGGIQVRAPAIAAVGDATFDETSSASSDPSTNPSSLDNYSVGRVQSAGPVFPQGATDANEMAIPGLAPFALDRTFWERYPADTQSWQSRDVAYDNGELTYAAAPPGSPGAGLATDAPVEVWSIGQSVAAPAAAWPPGGIAQSNRLYVYARIYDTTIAQGQNVVIGFGYVQWSWNAGTQTLTLTRPEESPGVLRSWIASGNASAVMATALPMAASGGTLTDSMAQHVFNLHLDAVDKPNRQSATPRFTNPLFAPVVVTHTRGR